MSEYTFGGWAMDPEYNSLIDKIITESEQVNRDRDIESFTKTSYMGVTRFSGVLKPNSTVTPSQLLAWADGGSLCFGGHIEINDQEFSGHYYTD